MGTSQGLFHFTEGTLAYAGRYTHTWKSPLHTHGFVEIAFAVGGAAAHHSLAGRREVLPGDVVLLQPGVWHGYENCQPFEVYNCCFSSELLRRELFWASEDPLLGYLLWPARTHLPGMVCWP
jgi:AraC family L-rhamnose operon transcriptional activator RhaR